MSAKGQKELSEAERREVVGLIRLHLETHPKRVAALYGLTPQSVRDMFRDHVVDHILTSEALTALRKRMVQTAMPLHGSAATSAR